MLIAACLPLAALRAAEDASPAATPTLPERAATSVYDPLRGLDANGRIPRASMPADVRNPERWRYIPEGRIAPGTIWERFLVTSFVAPIFYYEEDVGAGGGIALTDIDFRGQRRREFLGAFASQSTEGQENYALVWKRALHHRDLPGGGVISEERSWCAPPAAMNAPAPVASSASGRTPPPMTRPATPTKAPSSPVCPSSPCLARAMPGSSPPARAPSTTTLPAGG